jgi:hypothetical protein
MPAALPDAIIAGVAPPRITLQRNRHAFHSPLIDELVVKKLSVTGAPELHERS